MDNVENSESQEPSRSFLLRYGCAVASIALATWVRVLLDPILGDQSPFSTFLFAVLLTAWFGGLRPAVLALVLGVLFADYFLMPPRGSFAFKGAAQYVDLALYLVVGAGMALLGAVMQAAPMRTSRRLDQTGKALAQLRNACGLRWFPPGSVFGAGI